MHRKTSELDVALHTVLSEGRRISGLREVLRLVFPALRCLVRVAPLIKEIYLRLLVDDLRPNGGPRVHA